MTTQDNMVADAAYRHALAAVDRDEFATGPRQPPSAASLAHLLRLLDPQRGDRVLEIGTGSGYTAAVLSEIVGRHGDVITTEADVDIATQARERLIASGRESRYGTGLINVTVLRREPSDVPTPARLWDRVLFGEPIPLGRLPYAAVAGTRPGGVVVARIGTEFTAGPRVRFEVGSDGIAHGSADADSGNGIEGRPLLGQPEWRSVVAVAVPSCRYQDTRDGIRLDDPVTLSWAYIEQCDTSEQLTVRQSGPRCLADEVLAAVRWYADRGAPPLESWTWEVGPNRQCVTISG